MPADLHGLMRLAAAAPARRPDAAALVAAGRRRRRRRAAAGAVLAVLVVLAVAVPLTQALRPTVDFAPADTPPTAQQPPEPGAEPPATAPAAGSPDWTPMPDAPIAGRSGHAGVWTGTELVVWGGYVEGSGMPLVADGAAYDPAAQSWRVLAPSPLPARLPAAAVWTGTEVLVWGGTARAATPPLNNHEAGDAMVDGARYDPSADTWTAMAPFPLAPRTGAAVVWVGGRLVVWGGLEQQPWRADELDEGPGRLVGGQLADGAVYDPTADAWTVMTAGPLPAGAWPVAVSVGDRVLLAGGHPVIEEPECLLADAHRAAALYDPATDTWDALPDVPAPLPGCRSGPMAAWTGTQLLVWFGDGAEYIERLGGAPAPSGLRFDLAERRWDLDVASTPLAEWRMDAAVVWTGAEMIVWGGVIGEGGNRSWGDGAAYDPFANSWRQLDASPLADRVYHTAVWTGDAMLIWGGAAEHGPPGERDYFLAGDGAAYRPVDLGEPPG